MRVVLVVLLALSVSRQAGDPVRLIAAARAGVPALVIETDDGVRINARAAPVLELADGRRVRFGHAPVTADSAYFVGAPWAARPAGARVRGHLRVAFCLRAERFCRTALLRVELP